MSKYVKVQVSKTFVADVFLVVPDDFDGNVSAYSKAIKQQAKDLTPLGIHMKPWEEDVESFEFDTQAEPAAPHEIDGLGLEDCPEDKRDQDRT